MVTTCCKDNSELITGKNVFHSNSSHAAEQGSQRGGGAFVLGDTRNSVGQGPGQRDLTWKLALL